MKFLRSNKEYFVFIALITACIALGFLVFSSIRQIQGNARIVNFAGIVRGGSQKLIKEEIMGWYYINENTPPLTPEWYPNDALLNRLDIIINELINGNGPNGLAKVSDPHYLDNMRKVEAKWFEMKDLIFDLRSGGHPGQLFSISQDFFDLANDAVFAAEAYSDTRVREVMLLLAVVGSAFILLIISVMVYYVHRIGNPVKMLTHELSNLAKGLIGNPIPVKTNDEIGNLSKSVNDVSYSIRNLIDEISITTINYEKGLATDGIDINKFQGCYKDLSEKTNTMLRNMEDDFNSIMSCISAFSEGDFDVKLAPMPGERNIANKAMERLTQDITLLRDSILTLTKSATEGKIENRIDTGVFHGDWRSIAGGLNSLLAEATKVYPDIIHELTEIKNGNLNAQITKEYPGEYGVIKDTINSTAKEINTYITDISNVLGKMSDGNYQVSITNEYVGDFAAIKNGVNTICDVFNTILSDINNIATSLSDGMSQIADSSMSVAEGAQEQADNIFKLEQSMDKIKDIAYKSVESAKQQDAAADSVGTSIDQGKSKMEVAQTAMDGIAETTSRISVFLKELNTISFQTNLLALNASVEAARAGEHGKGFAVVASEVRSLANRSQQSSQGITELINEIHASVENGVNLLGAASDELVRISDDVLSITHISHNITSEIESQAEAINGNALEISNITRVTTANSAASEQTASSSQELATQVSNLQAMVKRFKLRS